jgi:TolB-like protein
MTAGRRTSGARITMTRRTARTAAVPIQPPPRRKLWIWASAALIALAVAGFAGWRFIGKRPAGADDPGGLDRHNIAVRYFEDLSPDHKLGYLADGLTEGLITSLGGVSGLSVVSRAGVAQYRGTTVASDSLARALRVGTVVTGSVEPENDSVRVSVRVLDDAGNEFGRATFKRGAKDLIALSDELAQEAAGQIRKRIGEEVQVIQTRAGTQNPNAWALFQRAQQARRRGDSLALAGNGAGFTREFLAADSLAAKTEALDPNWTDPIVLRSTLAYWRSRRADDQGLANKMVDSGLAHAERALVLDKNDPDALEMRGSLKYWRWLDGLEPDSARRVRLLTDAQADLEKAKSIRPSQASAWAMLSHLYANLPNKTLVDVVEAAKTALDKDAYLSNADVIINRLTHAYYDLEQPADAEHWCTEGERRFPTNWRFLECQLLLMTTKFKDPEPAKAWRLADSMVKLTPEGERVYQELNAHVLVAGILARAGLKDSASALLHRTKDDPQVDPSRDLANTAAFIWTLVGDTTEALNQIKFYLLANPGRRIDFADNPNWWFRGLQNDPRYREIVGPSR